MAVSNYGLRLCSWNARGIYSYAGKKLEFVQQILLKNNLDVVGIQESNLKPKMPFKIEGYETIIVEPIATSASGLIVIYKQELTLKETRRTMTKDIELIETKFIDNKSKNVTYITFVHCKSGGPGKWSVETLEDALQIKDKHIVMGDFNSKHEDWNAKGTDSRGKILHEFIDKHNLVIWNDRTPTRLPDPGQNASTLDLAITTRGIGGNPSLKVHNDPLGSDHLPILLNTDIEVNINELTKKRDLRFNLEKADWVLYNTLTEKHPWKEVESENNEIFSKLLTDNILDIAKQCIPSNCKNHEFHERQKTRHPDKKPKLTKHWWNEECETAKNARVKALRDFQKHGSIENRARYRTAKNRAQAIIKKTKNQAWRTYVSSINLETNTKEVWGQIAKLSGKHSTAPKVHALETNDNIATSDKEKADILAMQYCTISSDMNQDPEFKTIRTKTEADNPQIREKDRTDDCDPLNEDISLEELETALRHKKSSSPGEDTISYSMIRHAHKNLKTVVVRLFNQIFKTGQIPTQFKKAIVVPILKPGKNPNDPASYRPIPLTSQLGKCMETILNSRIQNFLSVNNLINPNQSGFRKKRTCLDQLARLDRYARRQKALSKNTRAAFLDLEKAYDTLWREGLLIKLKAKGFKGKIYNYVQDFLDNREFAVKVNSARSETKIQENGVPQGSVLSPILFNIMIDAVHEEIEESNAKLKETAKIELGQYADDIALWCSYRGKSQFPKHFVEVIERVMELLKHIGFKVNKTKTQLITIFPRKPQKEPCDVELGGERIPIKSEVTYLGVILDKFLNYQKHIDDRIDKASKGINIMRFLSGKSWGSSTNTLRTIYVALVRATLTYGQELYDSSSKGNLSKVDTVQSRALRLILRCPKSTNVSAMEVVARIPPLNLVRSMAINNFWTKVRSMNGHPLMAEYNMQKLRLLRSSEEHQPMVQKCKEKLKELELENTELASIPQIPNTWTMTPPVPDLGLSQIIDKKTTNQLIQKNTALSFIDEHYKDYAKIYTDGSKTNGKSAAGVTSKDLQIEETVRLDDEVSITTVELFAIHMAIKALHRSAELASTGAYNNLNVAILTDSKSAIQSLARDPERAQRGDLTRLILDHSTQLAKKHKICVALVWIPAHCGIDGNEQADTLAKAGISNAERTTIGLSTSEYNKCFRRALYQKHWQGEWQKKNAQTLKYIPTIKRKVKNLPPKLTRLILNRPYFCPYPEAGSPCLDCDRTNTVSHVLLDCKNYSTERQLLAKSLKKPIAALEDILHDDVLCRHKTAVKKFIDKIKLPV
ncbi:MAG: reverse transcriptase domain-containing protein [Actinomycetota bacterium]|nr:reverse transcriptase domain-containing protein [Actinomycetota bacterium]